MKKIIMLLFMIFTQYIYSYINIYPSFFFKELKREGTAETFILTNRSDQTVRYRIYPEKATTDKAIVELYPRSVLLNSYESKEVKLLITPKKDLKKGTYTFPIVVKEVVASREERKRTYTMLRLNLLGYYGDLKVKIDTKVKRVKRDLTIDKEKNRKKNEKSKSDKDKINKQNRDKLNKIERLDVEVKNIGERIGIFSIYLMRGKEWEFLDSMILKQNEVWKKIYEVEKGATKVKIEENDRKIYYEERLTE